jgi:hypothetical protein
VRVPVLSKHIIVILPATITLLGLMQKILFLDNLDKAKEMPIERHVGNAGGTVMVIRSSMLMTS